MKALLRTFGFAVLAFFVLTVVACHRETNRGSLDMDEIYESYELGVEHILRRVQADHYFAYHFDPFGDSLLVGNNEIRQLMASRLLAEMSAECPALLPVHEQNLQTVLQDWYREDRSGRGYVFFQEASKLGATAMLLRVLTASPLREGFRVQVESLIQGILGATTEEDRFDPWLIEPDFEYDRDYYLTFYSGEALLALAEAFEFLEDRTLLERALEVQDAYGRHYVDNLDLNYYPAYVPWHTMSLFKYYRLTGDSKYANWIFTLNDKLLEIQDTTNFVGRFYNPYTPQYGTPHVASDGIYTEGLLYAYDIAVTIGDEAHSLRYLRAIQLAFQNLRRLQYSRWEVLDPRIGREARGGFRSRLTDPRIRIDNTQHALDAFRKALQLHEDGTLVGFSTLDVEDKKFESCLRYADYLEP